MDGRTFLVFVVIIFTIVELTNKKTINRRHIFMQILTIFSNYYNTILTLYKQETQQNRSKLLCSLQTKHYTDTIYTYIVGSGYEIP